MRPENAHGHLYTVKATLFVGYLLFRLADPLGTRVFPG